MSLLVEAEKARQDSQFEKARLLYQKLARKPSLPPPERAETLLGLADMERIRGFFPEALEHYQQAAQRFKNLDPTAVIDAQVGWALAARASGQPQAAVQKLQKALIFYKKGKDPEGEAFVHWALGGTLRIAGDMKKGLKELLVALRLFKKLNNSEGLSYTCCALGGIYRMLGEYGKSGRFYREANRRMRQRKDTFGIAYSYCGLGNVERMAGRFKQALPFYKKAERLYGTIGDRVSYAYTLWSIGTTYKMLRFLGKAADYFLKADKLFVQTGDARGRIYVNHGLSEIKILSNIPLMDITKKNELYWRMRAHLDQEKNVIETEVKNYPWENLHEEFMFVFALGRLGLFCAKKIKYKNKKLRIKKLRKLKRSIQKAEDSIRAKYRKTGSKFYPRSIPVNWP